MTRQVAETLYTEKLDRHVETAKGIWHKVRGAVAPLLTRKELEEVDYEMAFFDDSSYAYDEFNAMRAFFFRCEEDKGNWLENAEKAIRLHAQRNMHHQGHWLQRVGGKYLLIREVPNFAYVLMLCELWACHEEQNSVEFFERLWDGNVFANELRGIFHRVLTQGQKGEKCQD